MKRKVQKKRVKKIDNEAMPILVDFFKFMNKSKAKFNGIDDSYVEYVCLKALVSYFQKEFDEVGFRRLIKEITEKG